MPPSELFRVAYTWAADLALDHESKATAAAWLIAVYRGPRNAWGAA
jgi:hypothetical protein